VIVRFLAVLELYKQGVVDLEQVATFADLSVRRLTTGEALDALSIADWDNPESTRTPGADELEGVRGGADGHFQCGQLGHVLDWPYPFAVVIGGPGRARNQDRHSVTPV